jgi:AAA ATPase domain
MIGRPPDPVRESARGRGDEQRHRGPGESANAGLQRAVAQHQLQELGEQEHRSEHPEVHRQRGGVGGGEGAIAEEAHGQHRRRGAQFPCDESDQRGNPQTGCADDLRAEPPGGVAAHERPDDPEQTGAGEADAGQVDGLVGAVALGELGAGEGKGEKPDRDVEPEDPLPADALRDGAADERSDRDREALDPAPGAERGAALLGWDRAGEDGERERSDDRSPQALECASGDQQLDRRGERGGGGPEGEDAEAGDEHAATAEAVPERGTGQQQDGEGQGVAVDGPFERVDPAAELLLDRGQGGGDDELSRAVMKIAIELSANAHSVLVLVVMASLLSWLDCMGRDCSGGDSLATRATRRNHRILFAGYRREMDTRHAAQPVLLERAEELAAIDAVIADTLAGLGRFGVIEGSAGIGKSSLLAEARLRAAAAGVTVLTVRGSEIERSFSYGVVRQLFERLLAQSDRTERSRLLAGAAAHAGRLFSAEQLPGQFRASEDDAFALVHGLYWLALNIAEERPLLISIDDLQWSDEASLRWVAYLVRRLEETAVGVVCAVRPIEDEDSVLADLLADPATTIVRPSALSVAAVTDLVRAELSADADGAFCVACHRVTGGNPLLLEEVIRTVAGERVAPSAGSVEVLERLAPDAVARSVRLRLARLPAEAAALARAVAVLGDGADRRHAAALAGIEQRSQAPAAAVLARVDLLRRDPPLRFVHPLVRNAVYEASPPHERAHEHAQAAAVLAAAGAPVEQIGAQLLLAPPETVEDAVAQLRPRHERRRLGGLPAARPDT